MCPQQIRISAVQRVGVASLVICFAQLLIGAALLVQGQRANQPRIEPQRTIKTNHEPNQMHSSHTEPDQNQNQNHITTEPDQNQNQNQTTTMG